VFYRTDEDALTREIVALASEYGRYGYRRITALLRDRGWHVGKDRVQRIWRREGLKVPQKQRPRGRLWLGDGSCLRLRPERANHVWSYDFVSAMTHDGRTLRMLTLIDEYTRECLAIRVARRLGKYEVIEALADVMLYRGIPENIRSDNVLTSECYKEVKAKISCASDFRRDCSLNPSGFHRQQKWHSTIATQGPLKFRGLHCT
jgi:transposase InsO family protein